MTWERDRSGCSRHCAIRWKGTRVLVVELPVGTVRGSVPALEVLWTLKGCYCVTDLWVEVGAKQGSL